MSHPDRTLRFCDNVIESAMTGVAIQPVLHIIPICNRIRISLQLDTASSDMVVTIEAITSSERLSFIVMTRRRIDRLDVIYLHTAAVCGYEKGNDITVVITNFVVHDESQRQTSVVVDMDGLIVFVKLSASEARTACVGDDGVSKYLDIRNLDGLRDASKELICMVRIPFGPGSRALIRSDCQAHGKS